MFTKSNARGGKMNGCGSFSDQMRKRNREILQSNAQVAFENVRKRLKTFENIRKLASFV